MSNKLFERIKKTRQYLITYIEDVSIESLNKIPVGFNNNIAWNLGHLIAAQQGICYVRAGLPTVVSEELFQQYKPGTKPEHQVSENDLQQLKEMFLPTIDRLEEDYNRNLFVNYPSWTTRYGVEIASIEDAIQFLMYHEGLHSGIIMALKRLV